MAKQFVLTAQVGSKLNYVNPTDFRHVMSINHTVAVKNALYTKDRVHNSKWTMRDSLEVVIPTDITACNPCQGKEKISIFLEVSGSVLNQQLVREALTRVFGNAVLLSATAATGIPVTNHTQFVAQA